MLMQVILGLGHRSCIWIKTGFIQILDAGILQKEDGELFKQIHTVAVKEL